MGIGRQLPEQGEQPLISLHELTIGLSTTGDFNIIRLVNPDFLKYNQVVDPDWAIQSPIIVDASSSIVRYNNGLSLVCTEGYLSVTQVQKDSPLSRENIVCHEVLSRFLEVGPPVTYGFIRLEPSCAIYLPNSLVGTVVSPLQELGFDMTSEGVTPEIQLRAEYTFDDREITIYFHDIESGHLAEVEAVRFSGQVYREVPDDAGEQPGFIEAILEGWESDVEDFSNLAFQFYALFAPKES